MMEATRSSETLVKIYQIIWRQMLEAGNLNSAYVQQGCPAHCMHTARWFSAASKIIHQFPPKCVNISIFLKGVLSKK
jgi:hypothetical protein